MNSKILRIEDTFRRKTTENVTSRHIWCCQLITNNDGPHKVCIFLRLRVFCTFLYFHLLNWVEEGLSFKEMYTLWGLS